MTRANLQTRMPATADDAAALVLHLAAIPKAHQLTLNGRRVQCRPVSVHGLLRYLQESNPIRARHILFEHITAPDRPRWWRAHPMRELLALSPDAQHLIIESVLDVPGAIADGTSDEAHGEFAKWSHAKSVAHETPRLALADALRLAQQHLGLRWLLRGGKHWGTADGFAPAAAVYLVGLAITAQQRPPLTLTAPPVVPTRDGRGGPLTFGRN